MKIRVVILLLVSQAFLLASCDSDDISSGSGDRVPIMFGTLVEGSRVGGANGDQWTDGDRIGVFMLKHGQILGTPGSISEGVDNKEYTADTDGGFTPAGGMDYYPSRGKVGFIAYYPYRPASGDEPYIYKVNVTDQSAPQGIDLMWAKADNDGNGYERHQLPVSLNFRHKLARLELRISTTMDPDVLSGLKVTMNDVPLTADFDLAEGRLANLGAAGSLVALTVADGTASEAIFIPDGKIPESKVSFSVSGIGVYNWDISDIDFRPGKRYIYDVVIKPKDLIEITAVSIVQWGMAAGGSGGGTTAVTYGIGDYYPDPHVVYDSQSDVVSGTAATGVVFWLDNGDGGYDAASGKGRRGKAVSLAEAGALNWSNGTAALTKAGNMDNGRYNMYTVSRHITSKKESWSVYPAFEWVLGLNGARGVNGQWYLPAVNELADIFEAYKAEPESFNASLTAAGGVELTPFMNYLSSTEEAGGSYVYLVILFNNDINIIYNGKHIQHRVRAVTEF